MLEILKDYGKANITPAVIARVLGMMTQTSHSNALVDGTPYVSTTGESSRTVTKSVTSWDSRVLAGSLQILVRFLLITCTHVHIHVPLLVACTCIQLCTLIYSQTFHYYLLFLPPPLSPSPSPSLPNSLSSSFSPPLSLSYSRSLIFVGEM